MEKKQVLKRLYVGGLGHTVSEAELQERFSKFGNVTDAEIVIRKDDQGNPMKTFAYINISISEADLKRCMSILNKARWKGGTLQIELAKESFLHRLAQERQEARLKKEKPHTDGKGNLLESLNNAGVVNFHMKAVPGTEVPDHKDWVVSKFGRVLPILHLKGRHKSKIMKYDPSKYCHNLRKLEQDLTDTVPISKLTWQLEGGDDSMSKKRRGEFPETKKTPKKMRIQSSEDLNKTPGCHLQSKKANLTQTKLVQMSNSKSTGLSKLLQTPSVNSIDMKGKDLFLDKNLASGVKPNRNTNSISDTDIDSEEEIKAMMEKEKEIQKAKTNVESESDHLEVVGDNFELKYNTHWSLTNPNIMKKLSKGGNRQGKTIENDTDYDSADTDEIIAVTKTPDKNSVKTKILKDSEVVKMQRKDNVRNETFKNNKSFDSANGSFVLSPDKLREKNNKKAVHNKTAKPRASELQDNRVDSKSGSTSFDSEPEASESEADSNYEDMMQNCYRLDLTLPELEALATASIESSQGDIEAKQRDSQCKIEGNISNTKYSKKTYEIASTTKTSINPEDIVAAILEGEESADDEKPMENTSSLKFQPFRGIGSLYENENFEEMSKEGSCSCKRKYNQNSSSLVDLKKKSLEEVSKPNCSCYEKHSAPRQSGCSLLCSLEDRSVKKKQNTLSNQLKKVSDSQYAEGGSEKPIWKPPSLRENNYLNSHAEDQTENRGDHEDCTTTSMSGSEEESTDTDSVLSVAQKHIKCELESPESLPEKPKKDANSKGSASKFQKSENHKKSLHKSKEEFCIPTAISSEPDEKEKQLQDNQKRLAALQERQKERELQKKLIQGALLNLESQSASKHKHIVFDSDGESEAEVEEKSQEEATIGNLPGKEFTSKISGKLFESSDDEQDAAGEDDRFQIKPQFEGKAGEKLMHLQSRFGTDERFRMDARFLESGSEEEEEAKKMETDEEGELAAEKKKNLEILGSLLEINLEHPKSIKLARNTKKFKDINTLRYDPTRQDHVVFERKTDTTEKESKAKRKKKREEAEKLPEVSKEIYYDVAVDLKEVFRSTKCAAEKSEIIPWDKHDAVEESTLADQHILRLNVGGNVEEKSSGFTFSFFGDDVNKSAVKEEPYVIETIRPARVAWQEDPRFQDSSSEEDDEPEASESENCKEMSQSLPQMKTSRFFFFSKDDERLRDGPKLFCRSSNLNEEKDNWENRRRLLLEECRKKHKDARRKVKAKQ
ncbi:nucleolar protein 8 isoform X1 [Mauremys mutica]|uniref:nucleolar protein 8 isoform X1 n=1 Tax=Mauremys mutica TaxID=74926 RepID=UPI001D169116|nr:nucleolar protein 8 isoform X1 [Mauremys mutica]